MANLIECPTCKKQISSNAATCPNCGEFIPRKRKWYHYVPVFFGLIPLVAVAALCCDGSAGNNPIMIFILLAIGIFLIGAPFVLRK